MLQAEGLLTMPTGAIEHMQDDVVGLSHGRRIFTLARISSTRVVDRLGLCTAMNLLQYQLDIKFKFNHITITHNVRFAFSSVNPQRRLRF